MVKSSKIVVATGNTSFPNMPSLPSQKDFAGPILHHKDFGKASQSILNDPKYKHIAVLGGGKSATDMVYESVKRGKVVKVQLSFSLLLGKVGIEIQPSQEQQD